MSKTAIFGGVFGLMGLGVGTILGFPKAGALVGSVGGVLLAGTDVEGEADGTDEPTPDATQPPFPPPDDVQRAMSFAGSDPSLVYWVTVDVKQAGKWRTLFAMPYLKQLAHFQAESMFKALKSMGYVNFATQVFDCGHAAYYMDKIIEGKLEVISDHCIVVGGPWTPLSKWP